MMTISDITIKKIKAGKFLAELPELYELRNVIENNYWHDHESTFDHTLKVLSNYKKYLAKIGGKTAIYLNKKIDRNYIKDLIFMAIILHDLGKKDTIVKSGDRSFFPLHEKISANKSKKILNKLDFSQVEKKYILEIIKKHSFLSSIVVEDNKKLENQFNRLAKGKTPFIFGLTIVVMMDTTNSYLKKTMPQKYQFKINFYNKKLKALV